MSTLNLFTPGYPRLIDSLLVYSPENAADNQEVPVPGGLVLDATTPLLWAVDAVNATSLRTSLAGMSLAPLFHRERTVAMRGHSPIVRFDYSAPLPHVLLPDSAIFVYGPRAASYAVFRLDGTQISAAGFGDAGYTPLFSTDIFHTRTLGRSVPAVLDLVDGEWLEICLFDASDTLLSSLRARARSEPCLDRLSVGGSPIIGVEARTNQSVSANAAILKSSQSVDEITVTLVLTQANGDRRYLPATPYGHICRYRWLSTLNPRRVGSSATMDVFCFIPDNIPVSATLLSPRFSGSERVVGASVTVTVEA